MNQSLCCNFSWSSIWLFFKYTQRDTQSIWFFKYPQIYTETLSTVESRWKNLFSRKIKTCFYWRHLLKCNHSKLKVHRVCRQTCDGDRIRGNQCNASDYSSLETRKISYYGDPLQCTIVHLLHLGWHHHHLHYYISLRPTWGELTIFEWASFISMERTTAVKGAEGEDVEPSPVWMAIGRLAIWFEIWFGTFRILTRFCPGQV